MLCFITSERPIQIWSRSIFFLMILIEIVDNTIQSNDIKCTLCDMHSIIRDQIRNCVICWRECSLSISLSSNSHFCLLVITVPPPSGASYWYMHPFPQSGPYAFVTAFVGTESKWDDWRLWENYWLTFTQTRKLATE